VSIAIIVGIVTNLGRGSWGVGHGGEGAKRKCMTGGVRLKDISIRGSGAAGAAAVAARRCKKRSMRARVCPPRSASLCLFGSFRNSSLNSPVPAPGIYYVVRWGSLGGFAVAHTPRFVFFHPSVSCESPDTARRHASRPRQRATADKSGQCIRVPATFTANPEEFSHFKFLFVPQVRTLERAPRIFL
jgi:hypothetical protein